MDLKLFGIGYFDDASDPENIQYGVIGKAIDYNLYGNLPIQMHASSEFDSSVIKQVAFKNESGLNTDYYYIDGSSYLYNIYGQMFVASGLDDGFGAPPLINRIAVRNGKIYVATERGIYWALTSNDVFSFIDATWGWNVKDIFITSTGRVYCAGEAGTTFTSPNGTRTGTKAQFAVLNPNHTVAVVSGNTHEWSTGAPWSVDGPNEMMVKEGAGTSGQDLIIIKVSGTNRLYKNDASGVGSFTRLGTTANTAGFNTTGGDEQPKKVYLSPNGRIFVFGTKVNPFYGAGSQYRNLRVTYSDDNGASWSVSTIGNTIVNASVLTVDNVAFGIETSANKIYMALGPQYLQSEDNGVTFSEQSLSSFYSPYENVSIHELYSNSSTMYVAAAAPSNTAPTDITLSASSISESAASGSTVGTLSATDAEGGAMTFSLVSGAGSTDNASFVIDGNALKTAVALDYETKSSYSIRVRATDSGSLTYEEQMTITVLNNTADDPVALVSAQLPILASGKTVASIAVDPRVVAVTLGGQALSEGSVIRNTVSGQKFMKSAGGVNAFVAIELTPKAAWSWSASANAAWEILQGF